ncbi:unnamed protein product [Oncorhynchus mykiss]|uniref:Pentraxin (PTX) domain-containing protein n=1 Tax=Oncorhynchus mykiss TaxID=8022 RepID=A0A060XVX4_ONCMY|nr:unnamed protein product [Oncorhynchus mykiss]
MYILPQLPRLTSVQCHLPQRFHLNPGLHDSSLCLSIERPMRRSLVFPMETDNSYVELVPQKDLDMGAFTLCMRVATELAKGNREIILFAYRTLYHDELNVWREADGRYSLYGVQNIMASRD